MTKKESNWTSHSEIANWIVKYLDPKVTVDIGTYTGYSALTLAENNNGHVYTIDKEEHDLWYLGFEECAYDNTTFIQGDSSEVVKTWDKTIDLLHIDGGHSREQVEKDLILWSQHMNPNGVVLMHDVLNRGIAGFGPIQVFLAAMNIYTMVQKVDNGLGILSRNIELMRALHEEFEDELVSSFDAARYWIEFFISELEEHVLELRADKGMGPV